MNTNPQFGISLDPGISELDETLRRSTLADTLGLDLITMQDHPYNRRFHDTWTLLNAIALRTHRARVAPNVANLPLRPPVMLAKAAATLDVLTNGRVEMALGAGGFWQAIEAYGGPTRSPGEAYSAFREAVEIMRGLWDHAGRSYTYEGEYYRVKGAQFGPAPAHRIPIWVGANGPRMLRLTGRLADGIIVSSPYAPPNKLASINALIDEGVAEAGRPTNAVRRGYNLMGTILADGVRAPASDEKALVGNAREWADRLLLYANQYRQDTFIFWASGDDGADQIRRFAEEVSPAVREALGGASPVGP